MSFSSEWISTSPGGTEDSLSANSPIHQPFAAIRNDLRGALRRSSPTLAFHSARRAVSARLASSWMRSCTLATRTKSSGCRYTLKMQGTRTLYPSSRRPNSIFRISSLMMICPLMRGNWCTVPLCIGLVNEVTPPAELIPRAEAIAAKIIANAPLAVQYAMEAVNKGMEMTLAEGLYLEATLFGVCCATEDKKEGTTAFLEKRAAQFKGK